MPYGPFTTLAVSGPADGVLHVELNRPKKLNAMNNAFWKETRELFTAIADDDETRCVVLSARGRVFTAGLDLTDFAPPKGKDPARKAWHMRRHIAHIQESFNAIEALPQPVIAVSHGLVIGGGVDMLCTSCIRYSAADAKFSIKEVDVGLAADVGTLQRLTHLIGNEGFARELAYTARLFDAEEARQLGFVTKVFPDKDKALQAAMDVAKTIASKSPVAVVGTKRMMTYSRDHPVKDGLDYIATWNGAMLQAPDMLTAMRASMQKKQATFAKL